jgi:hypothetical protein
MIHKTEMLLIIYMQKCTRNPIKLIKMTENEIEWLIWLIFAIFFEKCLILKT